MSAGRPVLLTVSGRIPADLEAQVSLGRRPRADYVAMGAAFDADVVDVDGALASTGRVGALVHRFLGTGGLLAWYCFRMRRRYEVIVTDGEQVGLPFAMLCRVLGRGSAKHMMIVHILSTPTKVRLVRLARLASMIDRYVTYCSWQRDFIVTEFGVPPERVMLSTFMVDTAFFDPARTGVPQERLICAAGLERRDYATLMQAVDGLDVRVVIAAASPWSTQSDSTADRTLPDNVEVRRLSLADLRDLYAASVFVVMPLTEVEFQAGITTILEAMAMERPVVCSRTVGQTDTIIDGRTGVYVPPRDAIALRAAIQDLLDDPERVRAMGAEARRWAVAEADIKVYVNRLTVELANLCGSSRECPPDATT
jgi:glycosyltransferase involved in cell wall biosynthesis